MAVTRTARGSATSKTSGSTLQIAAQSLTAGHLLVVYLAYDDQTLTSVFWGTQQLTLGDAVLGAGVRTRIAWCVADATASRTITATWAAPLVAKAMVADSFSSSVAGMIPLTRDTFNATNAGTGTTASTAAMGAIVGGTESVTVGVVGTEGPSGDTAGTFAEPNTAGQRVGTTGNPAAGNVTVSSAYRLGPTAGTTPALSKTGMTSRDWGAAIRHFYWGNAFSRTVTDTVAIDTDTPSAVKGVVRAVASPAFGASDALVASDNFNRADSSDWGTSSDGLITWGSATGATIVGSVGRFTSTGLSITQGSNADILAQEALARFRMPLADGGRAELAYGNPASVRTLVGGQLIVASDGTTDVQAIHYDAFDVPNFVAFANNVLTIAAGEWVWMRCQWLGSGTTVDVVRVRVWKDGDPEPSTWHAQLARRIVLPARRVSVTAIVLGGNVIDVDDLTYRTVAITDSIAHQQSSGPANLNRAIADTIIIGAESQVRRLASNRLHADTTSLTDSPSRRLAAARPLSDTTSVTDAIAHVFAALGHSPSDSVTLPADFLARALVAIRGPPDTVSTTDTLGRSQGQTRTADDTGVVSDTVSKRIGYLRSPQDIGSPFSSTAAFTDDFDGRTATNSLGNGWTSHALFPAADVADGVVTGMTSFEYFSHSGGLGPAASMLIRVRRTVANATSPVIHVLNAGLMSGSLASTGYGGGIEFNTNGQVRAAYRLGVTSGSNGAAFNGLSWSIGQWFNARVEHIGDRYVRVRVWPDGDTEPSNWSTFAAEANPTSYGNLLVMRADPGVEIDTVAYYPVAASELPARTLAAKRQLTETLTTTDSISHVYVQNAIRTATDTTTLTDDLSRALVAIRGPPDTVTTTDEIAHSTVAQYNRTADDTTSVTDSLEQLGAFTRSAVDITAVTDVTNQGLVRRADDSVSTADTIVGSGTYTRPIADTTAVTDDASRLLTAARQADDTTSASDALDRQIAAARAANDTVSTADSIEHTHDVGSVNFPRSAGDTIVVTDSVDPHGTFTREAIDSVPIGTDSIDTGQGARQRQAIDTLSTSDSVVAQLATVRTAAETTTTTESISQVTATRRDLDDTVTTTDSVEALSSASTAVTDTVTTTDTAARTVAASRATADSSTATDSLVRRLVASRPIADTTSATDDVAHSTSRSNQRALEDTTSQIDALATHLDATRRPADVVSGADSLLHAQAITRALSDSTTVTDAVAGTNAATGILTDSTSLTDDVTRSLNAKRGISEAIPTSDTTGGAQAWSRTLTDTVSGTDVALVRQRAIPAVVSSAHSTRNRASAQVVVRDARNIHRAETVVRSRTSAQSEVDSDA